MEMFGLGSEKNTPAVRSSVFRDINRSAKQPHQDNPAKPHWLAADGAA
jgi:hypothetical protein